MNNRRGRHVPSPQSADKAHNRKNCPDKMKIGCNFCFLRQLHLHPAVTYAHVSSLGCKFASLGGFAEPFGIVKSSRLWRQILPLAKFPCLQAFSTLCQSVDFVNILSAALRNRGAALFTLASSKCGGARRSPTRRCPAAGTGPRPRRYPAAPRRAFRG